MAAVATTLPDPAAEWAALLFERHHDAVLGYCAWRLRVRDDAEEAAQATFARAFGALRRGHRPRNERAWLVTIARNVCTTLVTSPHRVREIAGDVPETATSELDQGLDPALEAALAALPEGQRRAVLLREWHDLSYREIAAELGVSVGTVETWIFRGRRSLASALEHTRRAFGLGGLFRAFAPSAGAKLAAAAVLATAAVATEQAVGPHRSADHPRANAPAPVLAEASMPPIAVTSAARMTTAPGARVTSKRGTTTTPSLAVPRIAERARAATTEPPARPGPEPRREDPSRQIETTPTQPAAPTPELPVATPSLPPVETPSLPVATPSLPPVETPSLPAAPELPPVELPPLPSTDGLPVSTPTLP